MPAIGGMDTAFDGEGGLIGRQGMFESVGGYEYDHGGKGAIADARLSIQCSEKSEMGLAWT
jgi:hypothetical protein